MTVHFGIDLGTTFSTAAAARNGRVELLSLGTRSAAVPSVVFVREDGSPLVGEAAEARAQGDPSRFAREFKRRLGDPTPLILGGVPMGAERLSADVLAYLVQRATERVGEAPTTIALTHPASYTQYRLDLLGEAVNLAGLQNVRLLAEPRAAAIHYASDNRVQEGETVAVYDFGGGTFDTALVRLRNGEFDLIGEPQGIDRFGGIDIDLAVFDYVTDEATDLMADVDGSDPVNRAMLARLRADCRLAKERLSADTETVVAVATPAGTRDIVVTRRLLESMIRFRLADTVNALERAVRSAGLEKSDVSRVLLVGGSSRIPLVRTLLTESFGRPVSVDADPESTIALGAAAAAARWAGDVGSPAPAAPAAFAAPVIASTPRQPEPPPSPPVEPPVPEATEPVVPASPPPGDPPAPSRAAMAVPSPPPSTPRDIPPTPGTTPPGEGAPRTRRRGPIIAVAAVVALLIAGVVVVLATRDSGSKDNGSDTSTAAAAVGFSDDVKMNPPDGYTFEGMSASELGSFGPIAEAPAVVGTVALLRGAQVVDDDGSVPASVVRFQGDSGDMTSSEQQAVVDTVLGQSQIDASSKLEHAAGDITGTLFSTTAGGRGFVAPFDGGVLLVSSPPDGVAKFDDVVASLAKANSGSSSVPPTDTSGSDSSTASGGTVEIADGVGLNPPDGLQFASMPNADLESIRALVSGPNTESLDLILGSTLVDEQSSAKGSVVMFQNAGGELTNDATNAITDALLGEESVVDNAELTVNGVTGRKFTKDDGSVGWVGLVRGAVVVITLNADVAQFLGQDVQSMADNNPDSETQTTGSTVDDSGSLGDTGPVQVDDMTIVAAPDGFEYRPATDVDKSNIKGLADDIRHDAPQLNRVQIGPLNLVGDPTDVGGIIQWFNDSSNFVPKDEQAVVDSFLGEGTSNQQQLDVGGLTGTSFTRDSDNSVGWVGALNGGVLLIGLTAEQADKLPGVLASISSSQGRG